MQTLLRLPLTLLIVAGGAAGVGCHSTPNAASGTSPPNAQQFLQEFWASKTTMMGRVNAVVSNMPDTPLRKLADRIDISYAHELIASVNIDLPPGERAWVEAKLLGRNRSDEHPVEETPWFTLASFGESAVAGAGAVKAGDVHVDVDTLKFPPRYQAAEVRVRSSSADTRVVRFDLTVSRPALRSTLPNTEALRDDGYPLLRGLDLKVPFLSQKTSKKELSGRLCSPTSLAMVLNYHGAPCDVESVAAAAHDAQHDLYGNWPRNIQAAYSRGVTGSLTRFDSWWDVERTLADGLPIIASIFVEPGQLQGAPYTSTDGHLIVIRGMDDQGDLLVNDPAAGTPETGMLTYRREDMETVWLGNTKGTAYVLYGKTTK